MAKRLFDIFFSLLGLILLSPFFLIVSILIKKDSRGPVFYKGKRVGEDGKMFRIFKFRTMVHNAEEIGGVTTSAKDERLTKTGKFLRKRNLDEFPQLINVLKGEMSFVGPRPAVTEDMKDYSEEQKKVILSVKPGITDLSSLKFVHEEELIKEAENPRQFYKEKIEPEKIELGMKYVRERSFWLDLKIIIKTIFTALR
jgi:lipopolysaccharide/colanic/teichoic acid biosynthesis glycosyltransferase